MPTLAVKTEPPFWQLPVTALMENLNSSPEGLSSVEAAARLIHFGPNLIHAERKRALILQFLAKFRNPLVIILLTASALSAFTGDAASFFIISTIVLISVTLDFVQEYRAGQAAERLRQSVAVRGQVLRKGKTLEIPLAEMVPGDVALLAAGAERVMDLRGYSFKQTLVGAMEQGKNGLVEKTVLREKRTFHDRCRGRYIPRPAYEIHFLTFPCHSPTMSCT